MPKSTLQEAVLQLYSEIDCRIQHGAESNGHLEYVREELDACRIGMGEQGFVKCEKCGHIHPGISENCCWITCSCGNKICGTCGSTEIFSMDISPGDDSDYEYGCCLRCNSCCKEGCGMCV